MRKVFPRGGGVVGVALACAGVVRRIVVVVVVAVGGGRDVSGCAGGGLVGGSLAAARREGVGVGCSGCGGARVPGWGALLVEVSLEGFRGDLIRWGRGGGG